MTYQSNPIFSNFRVLTPEELCAVSGGLDEEVGEIVVTGTRSSNVVSISADSLASIGVFGSGIDGYFGLGQNYGGPSFDWFPEPNVELIDNDGDGQVDEMVLNIDKDMVTRAADTADDLAAIATFYAKNSIIFVGGYASLEAFLVSRFGMSTGAAAVTSSIMTDQGEDAFEDAMRDYFFDYLTGIEERPAQFPLENQHNNPYGFIYHP
jgi:hypothetical protein